MKLDLAPLAEHRATLDVVGEAARRAGARAFLVGGPVRDLLLNGVIRDVDIAIEGDATATVRSFVEATGLTSRAIDAFLTFKVRINDQQEIDIATTRRERYTHPGALPLVEPASIEEDLARRDFSINAIAIEIGRWTAVDPTGGVADLERRMLRALHSASFVDDPTRILRGLRLANRLQLSWEPATHDWLTSAIDGGALATVSRERVWRELLRAATEGRRCAATLLSIARSGALQNILGIPREPVEREALERFDHVAQETFEHGAVDIALIRLALLFTGSSPDAESLRGAPLNEQERAGFLSIAREPRRDALAIAALSDDGSKFDAIDAMNPNERVLAALCDPVVEPLVRRYVNAWLGKPSVRGDELGVPPGPWIGKAFRATRKALFMRAISPGEAAAFARRAAVDYLREQDEKE